MQVMKERDDSKPLSGSIQIDDAYWDGEHRGGSRGIGSENKTPFVVVVSINEDEHPIAMNLNVLNDFKSSAIKHWAQAHLVSGSTVLSDGLNCFPVVKEADCNYRRLVTGGGATSVDKIEFI